jgi:hypothetical protein
MWDVLVATSRESALAIAIVAVIALAMVVFYEKTTNVDPGDQANYRSVLIEQRQLLSCLYLDILRLRQGYLRHYDALEMTMLHLSDGITRLSANHHHEIGSGQSRHALVRHEHIDRFRLDQFQGRSTACAG